MTVEAQKLSRPPKDLTSFLGRKWLEKISTLLTRVGSSVADFFLDVGNSGTTETDLYSYSAPARTLGSVGDKLSFEFAGTFLSHATATRRLRVYFGGTLLLDTGAIVTASEAWRVTGTIIGTSPATARATVMFIKDSVTQASYVNIAGLNLSTLDSILKITGTAASTGAASDDIIARLGSVESVPAAS